jgi:hypothetical protein
LIALSIMDKILKRALLNSVGTFLYVIFVVLLLFFLRNFVPQAEDSLIIPIAMILLLVCSASITGFLVFGKPVMLYIDGKKKEAIFLLGHTIGILAILTVISFVFLISYFNYL